MKKILWYTDTHLNVAFPWAKQRFVKQILDEEPSGVFLTGDISNGIKCCSDLEYLARKVPCPIYFVYGNHDVHYASIKVIHQELKFLCKKYDNLFWLTPCDPIKINDNVAIVGTEGWYDGLVGDPEYLKYTTDWFLVSELRELDSHSKRLDKFREMAQQSADLIVDKLKSAFKIYDTVYVLTHFAPWKEASRELGILKFTEKLWDPYNHNVTMGKALENLMMQYPDKKIIVLCGHIHAASHINVSHNIECIVGRAKYTHISIENEKIFI